MQILIGCAKEMTAAPVFTTPAITSPRFMTEAQLNAAALAEYSVGELQNILGVSPLIATEVFKRYRHFSDCANPLLPAIAAYNGIVFRSMHPEKFSVPDFDFAQNHLWITSFLYGLLRPMDGIKLYRMEGNVVLPECGMTAFSFWRDKLTDVLIESVQNDDNVLVDLASSEMRQLFRWKKIEDSVTVIKPDFLVDKNGKLTMPSVHAKKCRGAMTAWIINNRITDSRRLVDFSFNGLSFRGDAKGEGNFKNPVFF